MSVREEAHMTQNDLHLLFSRSERSCRSVLSIYLDVDQSEVLNQNRAFDRHLHDMISSARATVHDAAELDRFSAAARHIQDFVSVYEPTMRGLVMFFDSLDSFFCWQEVGVPI